jgi:GDP-mannose 6-dehydrogenase
VDPQEVMRIFRMDTKLNVSEAYLKPGFAFGGSCLPKDIRALTYAARNADVEMPLISRILESNEAQIRRAVDAILASRKRRIGIVGLSFKPGTDDLRESPMVTLVETLIGKGLDVKILDHNVSVAKLTGANRRYIEEEIPHISSLMCTEGADLLNHAELLVVGNAGEEIDALLTAADAGLDVIDLTRGVARRSSKTNAQVDVSCQPTSSPAHFTQVSSLQASPSRS